MKKLVDMIGQDYAAYLIAFISYGFWVGSFALGAENPKINFANFNIFRGFSLILFNVAYANFEGINLEYKSTTEFKFLNLRNLFSSIQAFVMPFVLSYLSQSFVQTIACFLPIFVFIIDHIIYNISITQRQLYGIISSVISLSIMVNSHIIMDYFGYGTELTSKYHYKESSVLVKTILAVSLVVVYLLKAFSIILVKKIKSFGPIQININAGFISLTLGTIFSLYYPMQPMNVYEILYAFLTIGVPMCLAHFLYIPALLLTKNLGNISLLNYTSVIIGYGISIFIYNESLNLLQILGAIILLVGLIFVLIK